MVSLKNCQRSVGSRCKVCWWCKLHPLVGIDDPSWHRCLENRTQSTTYFFWKVGYSTANPLYSSNPSILCEGSSFFSPILKRLKELGWTRLKGSYQSFGLHWTRQREEDWPEPKGERDAWVEGEWSLLSDAVSKLLGSQVVFRLPGVALVFG